MPDLILSFPSLSTPVSKRFASIGQLIAVAESIRAKPNAQVKLSASHFLPPTSDSSLSAFKIRPPLSKSPSFVLPSRLAPLGRVRRLSSPELEVTTPRHSGTLEHR